MFRQSRTIKASIDERSDSHFVRREQRNELKGDDGIEGRVASERDERKKDDDEEGDEDRDHGHIETSVNLDDGQQQFELNLWKPLSPCTRIC